MDTLVYYKEILHEQRRADANGKVNYKANLSIERARIEAVHPEYIGQDCGCACCLMGGCKCVGDCVNC